jgi:hypothetical protein
MVSQTDGDILRTGKAVIRIAPGQGVSLAGSVVDTSSRGPEFQSNRIKPELAAPGASVSAEPGTGTGESRFGGTSGATPMVSGAAALLIQGHVGDLNTNPEVEGLDRTARLTPLEVKARLMNTAEISIRNSADGSPAPITRIGGGEVRIDRALAIPAAAWDEDQPSGALSFGFVDVADETVSLTKRVRLRNYSREKLTYQVRSAHQSDDDAATVAVTLSTPSAVSVDGGSDAVFEVTLRIDGTKLRDNLMDSGPQGNDPVPLTASEYDGNVILDDGKRPIHLAWHVLPRKAARVVLDDNQQNPGSGPIDTVKLTNSIELTNTSVGTAQNEAYSLLALSAPLPRGGRGQQSPTPDIRAIGVKSFNVPGGFCSSSPSYVIAFAVNTWERQTHANWPGSYRFNLDTNQDGVTDYSVFNGDAGLEGDASEGQNMTWALDHRTKDMSAFFFTEHATNTANTVLYVCAEQIGSVPPLQKIDVTVEALDVYFGGPGDAVSGITFAPFGECYQASSLPDIPDGDSQVMAVVGLDAVADNADDIGLLLFTNSDRGPSSRGGATADTEALVFVPPPLEQTPPTPSGRPKTDDEGGTMKDQPIRRPYFFLRQ